MEFRVGYTRTRDGVLTPRLSPSCARFKRSKNPEQPRTIRWETDNARYITELRIASHVDTHSEIQVARAFPELSYVYNVTPHAATGFSPFYLMFSRVPRLLVDIRLHRDDILQSQVTHGDSSDWLHQHQTRLKRAYTKATEQLNLELEFFQLLLTK